MDSKEFFYRLGKTLYKIDGFYTEFAKLGNVKPNLLWIMYALNDGKAHSQKEICNSWDLPRSTVNTIVKELESENIVELVQIKGEKRELSIVLTKDGQKYADRLLKDLYDLETAVYDKMQSDAGILLDKFEKLAMVLSKEGRE